MCKLSSSGAVSTKNPSITIISCMGGSRLQHRIENNNSFGYLRHAVTREGM